MKKILSFILIILQLCSCSQLQKQGTIAAPASQVEQKQVQVQELLNALKEQKVESKNEHDWVWVGITVTVAGLFAWAVYEIRRQRQIDEEKLKTENLMSKRIGNMLRLQIRMINVQNYDCEMIPELIDEPNLCPPPSPSPAPEVAPIETPKKPSLVKRIWTFGLSLFKREQRD